MSPAKTLAYRMLQIRMAVGFTQEEEAARFGITRAALSHYEKGRRHPDFDTLVAFADLHNVSIDYLLGRSSEPMLNAQTSPEQVSECYNDDCTAPIYAGQKIYKVAGDDCCSMSCAEKVRKEIKIEFFII